MRPRDNVPVLSWLVLRGRCRDCGEPIASRYPLVEAATALRLRRAGLRDRARRRRCPRSCISGRSASPWRSSTSTSSGCPNVIVLPSYVVAARAARRGRRWSTRDWDDCCGPLLGMAALYGFYFVLAFVYPAGMGFGDVKLAGVLGLYLGWLGLGGGRQRRLPRLPVRRGRRDGA